MKTQPDMDQERGSVLEPDIAPLERLTVPLGLTGEEGTHRMAKAECRISAQCDRDAIFAWLADVAVTDTTYTSFRGAAEKLLNWAYFEQHVALSSLEPDDLLDFISFLNAPRPAIRWISPRGTRRASERWRPFSGALCAASQLTVIRTLASLFEWLFRQQYALLPPIARLRYLSSGLGSQSMLAAKRRCAVKEPLSRSAWRWVEKRIADSADPPTLETRFALELLYFGGMQLVEVRNLLESHCVAPTRSCPAWRLYLPKLRTSDPCVYALPPLARTLEAWFRPIAAMSPRRSAADAMSNVPVFCNCARTFKQIGKLLREAGAMAADHDDHLASHELTIATPMALRRAIEAHGANDLAFAQGFVAHSWVKRSAVLRYYESFPVTRRAILDGWRRLRHLWSTYPLPGGDTPPTSKRSGARGCTAVSDTMLRLKSIDPRLDPRWTLVTFTAGAAIDVYRSLDRYIRTHVAPRCYATLTRSFQHSDLSQILSYIQRGPDERAAWTYRLWVSAIDPTIGRRGWTPNVIAHRATRRVQLTIPAPKYFVSRASNSILTDQVVLNHTGELLMAVWHSASELSRTSVANRQMSWGSGAIRLHVDEHGQPVRNGEVAQFDKLTASPQSSKAERSLVRAREARDRIDRLAKACRGDCLTYRGCMGWSLVEDRYGEDHPAANGNARRAKLLGVEGRPTVVLYEDSGQYAARLSAMSLQAIAPTPKECFDGLRDACQQYRGRYGAKWL